MKKIILSIATILAATFVFAQKPEFGVKVGLNFANESTDDGSTEARTGANAGVFAEFFLSKRLGLQPELVYSMQGGKYGSSTDKLDYINLPVMLKIYVLKRALSVDVGPQFGYMISAKVNDTDIYDVIDNKLDVSLGLGVSYKFAKRFDVGLRFNIGMTKIMDNMDHKNSVAQLGVGFRF